MPIIRYPAGIIMWPKDIEATDIKIRKLLTMEGGYTSKSSTLRLHNKQREESQRLVSFRDNIQDVTAKVQEYIR